MKKFRSKKVFFFSALLLIMGCFSAVGQRHCGTVEYKQFLIDKNRSVENEIQFEEWIQQYAREFKLNNARTQNISYKIQVVVHIIHNGEPIGTGSNISDAQVQSQLNGLNTDFNRLNADTVNTPAEFKSLAGKMNIQFVLATQDPNGQPSAGITRTLGTKSSWTINDNDEFKSLSYWPAEDYLNIWVCNLTDYFGFTQLPVSTLDGLENTSKNRLTDGVTVWYKAFGKGGFNFNLDPTLNLGRTTTHEVGHFLGLRHLWGDVTGCGGSDYVDDTPPQSEPTSGCPAHPQKECPATAPVAKMFQNYLDYSDDACMNLFTRDQVSRMKIVLENSPRRFSLLLPFESASQLVQFQKIFSPNGDGINDFWKWDNTLDYQGCALTIYNRFGKKIYEKVSYDNSWDGRSTDGYALEAEAYYYIIRCSGQSDITGGVRIVR